MGLSKALIVGAGGQVGRQLVVAIGEENCIPTFRSGDSGIRLDLEAIAQGAALPPLPTDEISVVFIAGAATDVERCETDPAWAMRVNCEAPLLLAEALPRTPLVCFSTDYVFDGENGPYREEDAPRPISVYGRSKLLAEQRLLDRFPQTLVIRTNVVYGPDAAAKNFLYSLRRQLIEQKPVRVVSDQISTPTYNRDLATAAVALAAAGATGIVHVSGPDWVSRFEFAVRAARELGLREDLLSPIVTAELRQKAPRPLRGGLRNERLAALLPSAHMGTPEEGVRRWQQQL